MHAAAWFQYPFGSSQTGGRIAPLGAAALLGVAISFSAPAQATGLGPGGTGGTGPQLANAETVVSDPVNADVLPTQPVELSYEVYFGGMNILRSEARLTLRDGAYRLEADGFTKGLVDFFVSWTGQTYSEGRFGADGTATPTRHRQESSWKGKERELDIRYDADGAVIGVDVAPPLDLDEVTPLPEGAEIGTVDALSVIAEQSYRITSGQACDAEYAVYDGRRRFDLTITSLGDETIQPNDYSVYNGPAVACRVEFELLGGERKEKSKYAKTARNRTIFVAQPLEDGPSVPVRLRIDTDYGTLTAHLTRIAVGDRQIALKSDD